jgi:integral membrane protein
MTTKRERLRMSEQVRPGEQMRPVRDVIAARKALVFFRVMAIVAGCALFVLLYIIVVVNRGIGKGGASAVWSPIHGFIYLIFVASIANLGFKVGWSLPRMIRVMLCGFVPVLPFIVERRVAKEVEAQLAGSVAP